MFLHKTLCHSQPHLHYCSAFICNTFAFDTYPYTHIRELTSMLQTTWAAKNPLINLYGNVPFPPLTYKKHREAFSLTGPLLKKFVDTFSSIQPPPQGATPHILIHRTPFQLIRIGPFLFPSPFSLLFPSSLSPAQPKAGLHTVQARFLSLLSLLYRYDNGFTDT